MRLLLDTHVLLWWLAGDRHLSRKAKAAIADADTIVHVSAASIWEIATKFRVGKLPGVAGIVHDLPAVVASQVFESLAVTGVHALRAGLLPGEHRDPFDRMLVAQSICEGMTLVSSDPELGRFGIDCLW